MTKTKERPESDKKSDGNSNTDTATLIADYLRQLHEAGITLQGSPESKHSKKQQWI
jgi:hypothetical protein